MWIYIYSLSLSTNICGNNIFYTMYIIYAHTFHTVILRFAHTPSMLYTWGYQELDFTFNWEDQQGYLGNINFPPPLNFYIHWRSSIRVYFSHRVKLLHSLKIFNKGLILPPPLNFYIHWINKGLILPPPLNFYIHWRSSIRVYFSHPR